VEFLTRKITIKRLRTLRSLRSKTFPTHIAGSDQIKYWKELQIQYPITDDRQAVIKVLQALDSSLNE
jgi:hypothetical protein